MDVMGKDIGDRGSNLIVTGSTASDDFPLVNPFQPQF
jgi:hypothetical protein